MIFFCLRNLDIVILYYSTDRLKISINTFIILFSMRKILSLLIITCIAVGCVKKSTESYYIPKDAIGVMYVNLESLSKKSSEVDFKDLSINKIIEDSAPKELQDFMNEYMTSENINATFRKEFILGFVTVDRMSPSGGLILPIKDGKSFEKMIQPMLEKIPRMKKEENVGKNNAFTVYSTNEVAIGWDNETALIVGAKSFAGTELIDLTNLKKSESVYATDYYKGFFDTNKDFGMHITSTPLSTVIKPLLAMAGGMDIELENNNMTYYGSFEDDHIHTEAKLKLNNDFKSILGYNSWMTKHSNTSLLNAIPENPAILMKVSMDPVALYKHVESLQDNKILPVQIRGQLKQGIQQMNNQMNQVVGMNGEDLAGIFDGSMLFAITKGKVVKDTVYTYNYYDEDAPKYNIVDKGIPNMYAAIAIKDKSKFDTLMGIVMEMQPPMETKGKNYYQLEKDLFVVAKGDVLFMTNDVAKADELYTNGKLAANLSSFEHKDNLAHSMYMYLSPNFPEMYTSMMPGAASFGPYGSLVGDLSKDTNNLFTEYFADNHFFMDADGMQTFTYTKGEGNSLVRMMMYSDAMAKQLSEMAK